MSWFVQFTIAIIMIVFYIVISIELHVNPNLLDRQLLHSLGIGMFTTLFLIFWVLQYKEHNTLIYWRIIELFK